MHYNIIIYIKYFTIILVYFIIDCRINFINVSRNLSNLHIVKYRDK